MFQVAVPVETANCADVSTILPNHRLIKNWLGYVETTQDDHKLKDAGTPELSLTVEED